VLVGIVDIVLSIAEKKGLLFDIRHYANPYFPRFPQTP